jgi:folate-binding Fe-S cluster repair protein YgfZ
MKTRKAQIDTRSFIAFWGGPAAMVRTWKEHDINLTREAVEKWIQRKTIPSQHLLHAVAIATKKRRPLDLRQFIKNPG